MSSLILKLHMGLVIFLNIVCLYEFIREYPFFITIVLVCQSRTIGKKDQCVQQTIKYLEQREL